MKPVTIPTNRDMWCDECKDWVRVMWELDPDEGDYDEGCTNCSSHNLHNNEICDLTQDEDS